jgi:hypothetical protein
MKKYKLFSILTIFIYTITTVFSVKAKDCNLDTVKSNEIQQIHACYDNSIYHNFATVYINDEIILPPTSLNEVEGFLDKIKTTIMNTTGETAVFKYGNELQLKLKLPYLGIGRNGIVFTIINDDQTSTQVLKLNILRGNKGLISAQKETTNYLFWSKIANNNYFSVAKLYDHDSLGLYTNNFKVLY